MIIPCKLFESLRSHPYRIATTKQNILSQFLAYLLSLLQSSTSYKKIKLGKLKSQASKSRSYFENRRQISSAVSKSKFHLFKRNSRIVNMCVITRQVFLKHGEASVICT